MTRSCRNCRNRVTYRHKAIPLELHECVVDSRRIGSLDFLCGSGSGRSSWEPGGDFEEVIELGTDELIKRFPLCEEEISDELAYYRAMGLALKRGPANDN